MSRKINATGQDLSRKSARRKTDSRRREALGRFGYPGSIDGSLPAIVQRLEDRTLLATANLMITASAPTPEVGTTLLADQEADFLISVKNNGPDAATGLTLVDTFTLLHGVTSETVTIDSATETDATGNSLSPTPTLANPLTLTLADPVASGATVSFKVVVTPTLDGTLSSSLVATPGTGELNMGDSIKTTGPTTIDPAVDLVVSDVETSPTPATVPAGQQVTYTVTVTNNGPSDATGVTLTDAFSLVDSGGNPINGASVDIVSVAKTSGNNDTFTNNSTNPLTIDLSSLPDTHTDTFTIKVKPSIEGTLKSSTSATANESITDSATDAASDVTVTPAVALTLSLTAPSTAVAGQDAAYTLTVTNNGPSAAMSLSLADLFSLVDSSNMPINGATVTVDSIARATGSNSGSDAFTDSLTNPLAIDFTNAVPKLSADSFTIKVKPSIDGTLKSAASATVANGETSSITYSGDTSTTVKPAAALVITNATPTNDSGGSTLEAGQAANFAVTLTNNGPSAATNLMLSDTFGMTPSSTLAITASASYVVGSGMPVTVPYTQTGSVVKLNVASLPAGAVLTLDVAVTPSLDGTLSSTIATSFDSNEEADSPAIALPSPNPLTVTIAPVAQLTLANNPATQTSQAGQAVTFHVSATNVGPSSANGLVLTDMFSLGGSTTPAPFQSISAIETDAFGALVSVTPIMSNNVEVGVILTFSTSPSKSLGKGQAFSADVTLIPLRSGTLTSTLSANLAGNESDPGNTPVVATTTIVDYGVVGFGTNASPPVEFTSPGSTSTSRPTLGNSTTVVVYVDRTTAFPSSTLDNEAKVDLSTSVTPTVANGGLLQGTDFTVSVGGMTQQPGLPILLDFPVGTNVVEVDITINGTNSIGVDSAINLSLQAPAGGTGGASINPSDSTYTVVVQNKNSLVVTNTSDSATVTGSLRQVLATVATIQSTLNPFPVPITFNIPPGSSPTQATYTFTLGSDLDIPYDVLIDGSSQPNLDGYRILFTPTTGMNGYKGDGLVFDAGSTGSTLQDVIVQGFVGNGIDLYSNGVTVRQSQIIDNHGDGVAIGGNTIGGKGETIGDVNQAFGNMISGNSGYGVAILTTSNSSSNTIPMIIEHNTIDSATSPATSDGGIYLDGIPIGVSILSNSISGFVTPAIDLAGSQSVTTSGNTISGTSGDGILLTDAVASSQILNNSISGVGANFIGIDVEGTVTGSSLSANSITGSTGVGIEINDGSNTTINGLTSITGLGSMTGGLVGIIVGGSAMGTSISGTTIKTPGGDGIDVGGSATGTTINGGSITSANNDGISLGGTSSNTTITNAQIQNSNVGISISGVMDTTLTGAMIIGSTNDGVVVVAGTGTSIGTSTISNSGAYGVEASGAQSSSNPSSPFIQLLNSTISGTTINTKTGTTGDGVFFHDLIAITNPPAQNLFIDGNEIVQNGGSGIHLSNAPNVVVASNNIGVAPNGLGTTTVNQVTTSLANTGDGIEVGDSNDVVIGGNPQTISLSGTDPSSNFISQNLDGVVVTGSTGVKVQDNYIGRDNGTNVLGNADDGISISDSTSITVAGNHVARSGYTYNPQDDKYSIANAAADGVRLVDSPDVVFENDVESSASNGLEATASSSTGLSKLVVNLNTFESNSLDGLKITGDGSQSIQALYNTASHNSGFGLEISQAPGLLLSSNIVGTDSANTTSIGNSLGGASITSSNSAQVLSNTISGNADIGLILTNSATVTISGNTVGLGVDHSTPLGNAMGGVSLSELTGAMISNNFISENGPTDDSGFGLEVDPTEQAVGSTNVSIIGNDIGADGTGNLARGNHGVGVIVGDVPDLVLQGNLISANAAEGLHLIGTVTPQVVANIIGGGIGGTVLGNGLDGIQLSNTTGAVIEGNVVANNLNAGIDLLDSRGGQAASGASISGNTVEHNTFTGIAINGGGNVSITGGNIIGLNGVAGIFDNEAPSLSITGNFIGLDSTPSMPNAQGNLGDGILVGHASGVSIAGNIIANNAGNGVNALSTPNLTIMSNAIGTSDLGASTTALGNLVNGILIDGGASTSGVSVSMNRIVASGQDGVHLLGNLDGMTLASNLIGGTTPLANGATTPLANKLDGVTILASPSESGVVSVTAQGNQIFDNGQDGIQLDGAQGVVISPNNSLESNLTNGVEFLGGSRGDILAGSMISGNQTYGIKVSGSSFISISAPVVTGNLSDGIRIDTDSASNTITGGTIEGNFGNGVAIVSTQSGDMTTGNLVQDITSAGNLNNGISINGPGAANNTLGNNTIGIATLANEDNGISISNAGPGNTVVSNTIVNSLNDGISISLGGHDTISGNFIGTDSTSDSSVGNHGFGLAIDSSNNSSVIGNDISFNQSNGVVISGASVGNSLLSNTIGTNNLDGVLVLESSGNTIGSLTQGNTIFANGTDGVALFNGSIANDVVGNTIGTVQGGSAGETGNQGDGVHVISSTANVILSNVVSGNSQSGVEIFGDSSGNSVDSNILGTLSGNASLGNKLNGLLIAGSPVVTNGTTSTPATSPHDNFIGVLPDGTAAGNFIAGNQSNGVVVVLATSNQIQHNVIQDNAVDGVSLAYANGNSIDNGNIISVNKGDGIGLSSSFLTDIQGNTISYNSANGVNALASSGSQIQNNQVEDNVSNGIALTSAFDSDVVGNVVQNNGSVTLGSLADGIVLTGSSYSIIQGNQVQGNTADGIRARLSSNGNLIGADTSTVPNLITSNGSAGIEVSSGSTRNSIQNNLVGFTYAVTGAFTQPFGVYLNNVSANTIGGVTSSASGPHNTITGNESYGILVSGNDPTIDPTNPAAGNTIQNNLIGTDGNGNAPLGFLPQGTPDVGVLLLDSTQEQIVGNVVSGNHKAGIELFGGQSTGNTVAGNVIGSTASMLGPVLTSLGANVYSALNRQDYGVWINGAAGNTIGGGNDILGNYDGIHIQGSTATGNLVAYNNIGQVDASKGSDDPLAANYNKLNGLGNVNGIYIDNTGGLVSGKDANGNPIGQSGTTIQHNIIDRNVLNGVSIVGLAANFNIVQSNSISGNGGFGLPTDGSTYVLTLATPGRTIYPAAGVYIEQGSNNIIGQENNAGDPSQGNTISNNSVAGVYVYNYGTDTNNPNLVKSNTITGDDSFFNPEKDVFVGEYGVLLFNSSGNNPPAVALVAPEANNMPLSSFTIASFREFTGTTQVPNLLVPGSASASSASVEAASVGHPTIVKTVGKGHPLPPAKKNFLKK
jgi:uncharacterized repeat protein (TIGR01451 family)